MGSDINDVRYPDPFLAQSHRTGVQDDSVQRPLVGHHNDRDGDDNRYVNESLHGALIAPLGAFHRSRPSLAGHPAITIDARRFLANIAWPGPEALLFRGSSR